MPRFPLLKDSVTTQSPSQMIDVTDRVQKAVRQHQIEEGYVILYVPHTTAGVTIQENADPDVKTDLLRKLEMLIPRRESFYQHAEGNSDSHLKTAMLGNSAMVLIENGRLVLGQWQGIYFCEFDGPRQRELLVKLVNLNPHGA